MDVRLPDGKIIQNVPDGTTKADLAAKLKANGYAVPDEWLAGEPSMLAKAGQAAIGAGEAALSTVSGATTGALGLLGGTVKGIAQSILNGDFGTQKGVETAAQQAQQLASMLTYSPRTESGQAQAQAVGETLAPLIAATPLMSEIGIAGQSARLAAGQLAAKATRLAAPAEAAAVRPAPAIVPEAQATTAAAPVVTSPAASAAETAAATEALANTARKAAVGGVGSSGAKKVLANEAAPDPVKVKAFEDAGLEYQPDYVSASDAYRNLVGVLKSGNTGSALSLGEKDILARNAERASALIDEIGGSRDLSAVSQNVRDRLQATVAELNKQVEALYNRVAERIGGSSPAPAPSTVSFLEQQARELGGVDRLNSRERNLLASLAPTEDGTSPVTYAYLDRTRKDIGRALNQATGPFKDSESGFLKTLYARLSDDQQAAANRAGIGDVFTAAKAAVESRKGVEGDLQLLFGRDLQKSLSVGLSGVSKKLAAGDADSFARLIAAVPADLRQQVSASALGSMFGNAATRGEINFTGFAKWFDGLKRNQRSYDALFSNLPPEAARKVISLANASKAISESLATRIKTGQLKSVEEALLGPDKLVGKMAEAVQRNIVAGTVTAATTATLGPVAGSGLGAVLASSLGKTSKGMAAVEELIASPEFARAVAQSPGKVKPSTVKAIANSKAFNRFVSSLPSPSVIGNREAWILAALEQDVNRRQQSSGPTVVAPSSAQVH